MSYTIVDLLDKFISIEQAGYKMYLNITKLDNIDDKIKTIARVFAAEEKNHVQIYKALKTRVKKEPNIDVDFFIYDKASTLIYQFANQNKIPDTASPRGLLKYCHNFEKDNLALLLRIRGLFVNSKEDEDSINYKTLSEIIDEEQKHIKNIGLFIGGKYVK